MHILIALPSIIPAPKYGGTERVIWYLGRELVKMGHKVTFLVKEGSYCDFASVLIMEQNKPLTEQIPNEIDLVHFNYLTDELIDKPSLTTIHGNINEEKQLSHNSIFVSADHAKRFGSNSFIYNGMDWNDYGEPNLNSKRTYFHYLAKAAWRLKNVQGAIDTIKQTKEEKLKVLGGSRLNFKMGFRFTLSPRIEFHGMVGGEEKNKLLRHSKGLIFPVRWHEPFGIAIIESLYFGCPVFGTPYGSLPELVSNEVGFLSNSSSALAAAVVEYNSYSRVRCHDYAVELFNSKKMAEAYLKRYEQVLNGGKLNFTLPKLIKIQEEKFLPWLD